MVIYSIFHSLGLKPEVRPPFDPSVMQDMMADLFEDDSVYLIEKQAYRYDPLRFTESLGLDAQDMEDSGEQPVFPNYEERKEKKANVSRAGKGFHPLKFCQTEVRRIRDMTWRLQNTYDYPYTLISTISFHLEYLD
jgi:hypothetical protein